MPNEYLTFFSTSGPVTVDVKLKGHAMPIARRFMQPADIDKLVGGPNGNYLRQMHFDGWPFEIAKYEIDPIHNRLTITAQTPKARKPKQAASGTARSLAPWSQALRVQTLEQLWNPSATHDGALRMKHKVEGYGHFQLVDIVARRLTLSVQGLAEPVQFDNPEAVLAAGWAMD